METGVEGVTMLKLKILKIPTKKSFVELNDRNSVVGIVTSLLAGGPGLQSQ